MYTNMLKLRLSCYILILTEFVDHNLATLCTENIDKLKTLQIVAKSFIQLKVIWH